MSNLRNATIAFVKDLDARNENKLDNAIKDAINVMAKFDALNADLAVHQDVKDVAKAYVDHLVSKLTEWLALHKKVRAPLTPFEEKESPWVEQIKKTHSGKRVQIFVVDFNSKKYRDDFKKLVKFPNLKISSATAAARKFEKAVRDFENSIDQAVDSEYDQYQNLDKKTVEKANRDLDGERDNNKRMFAEHGY